jgi:hypothetical protein
MCGTIASSIWNFVCMVIGLSEVHGISKARATVAILLPSIVCCGLAIAAVTALIVAAGGMSEVLKAAMENV